MTASLLHSPVACAGCTHPVLRLAAAELTPCLQGGNLGPSGMQNFLETHTCGPTCKALDLAPVPSRAPGSSGADSSEASLAAFLDDWHIVEE